MALGWKIVAPSSVNSYPSAFTRSPQFIATYTVGFPVSRPLAPMFMFSDDLQPIDLLTWGLHQEYPVVLLRVEAHGKVSAATHCAQEESDYAAYWQTLRDGGVWPLGASFLCPPKTLTTPRLIPRMTVWAGARAGRTDAELLPELSAAFDTARKQVPGNEPVEPTVDIFLPIIRA